MDSTPKGPVLYRAPYVVPVMGPLIDDGGVLVNAGRIVAVDRFCRLRQEGVQVVELEQRIITPALINCHTHLELSYLADLGREAVLAPTAITAWIRTLIAKRGEAVPPEEILRAGREALAAQYLRGIALVADIGNLPLSRTIGEGSAAECLFFQEVLGVTAEATQAVLATLSPAVQYTAHAPYSCHPSMLTALKERARQSGQLFSIHVAESVEEIEFSHTGQGPFRQFLIERLRLVGALAEGQDLRELVKVPGCGTVEYLHGLNLLDPRTICVHVVHLSELEAELLAQTRAKVCLCPASNRRLGVGTAKVPMLIRRQILPGLGTDSLASNECLDLWHEMQLLQEDHPDLAPQLIFSMATLGGAVTLGATRRLGAVAPGLEAKLLAVDFNGTAADLYPFLVNSGRTLTVDWLETGSVG